MAGAEQTGASGSIIDADGRIAELLPLDGLVYSERQELSEVMCKPKILPIKSVTMERLEQLEEDAAKAAREARTVSKPMPVAQAQQPDSAGLQVVAEEAKEEGDNAAAAAASSAAVAAATAEAAPPTS
ncbi:hypothetical protein FNF27_07085 [Cafeteria roenbergensis]|uniref:Uncharacterized protein n=1 Tax=Cafeteria roenbergensis TaxID=33653 RepID=A0A5A8DAU6_CAFRO|nr:hypothetical protein FNF29_04438 [Cafeteria roenbergensis]KAA0151768.1 hypothetical protein FNF31_06785 [Cafeteria roenbergensis]KAA0162378.1 hypothetical protein FNF28_04715 [Cafeteria roenbergensis]KAA0168736.1 hypothetical protein FNF27_07085 [Cafeteria roenbergensis]|eukprot:KAA0151515.1 hypothetical protein FNF29_04438 [Cafeteria roenbergensis]